MGLLPSLRRVALSGLFVVLFAVAGCRHSMPKETLPFNPCIQTISTFHWQLKEFTSRGAWWITVPYAGRLFSEEWSFQDEPEWNHHLRWNVCRLTGNGRVPDELLFSFDVSQWDGSGIPCEVNGVKFSIKPLFPPESKKIYLFHELGDYSLTHGLECSHTVFTNRATRFLTAFAESCSSNTAHTVRSEHVLGLRTVEAFHDVLQNAVAMFATRKIHYNGALSKFSRAGLQTRYMEENNLSWDVSIYDKGNEDGYDWMGLLDGTISITPWDGSGFSWQVAGERISIHAKDVDEDFFKKLFSP